MNDLNMIGSEVYAVINKLSKEMYNKIPMNIITMFEKFEKDSIKVNLKDNIPFEEQDISKEAKDIIFAISLNYLLTDEERNEVLIKLKENENTIKEKYNVEKIFREKSEKGKNINTENIEIIKHQKEKWYKKIIDKIKSLFFKR